MSVNIRRASKSDKTKLLKWGKELWQVEKQFEPLLKHSEKEADERYSNELENPKALFLVAEFNGEPVGYLYSYLKKNQNYLQDAGLYCELEVIYIDKKARKKGLADRLIEECIKWAKDKGAKHVKAGVYVKNTSSLRLLGKKGFENYHITLLKSLF